MCTSHAKTKIQGPHTQKLYGSVSSCTELSDLDGKHNCCRQKMSLRLVWACQRISVTSPFTVPTILGKVVGCRSKIFTDDKHVLLVSIFRRPGKNDKESD